MLEVSALKDMIDNTMKNAIKHPDYTGIAIKINGKLHDIAGTKIEDGVLVIIPDAEPLKFFYPDKTWNYPKNI